MAVKFKITAEEHAKLPEALRDEYHLVGSDYVLLLDGGPDPKAAGKFDAERDKRRAAEKRASDAETRVRELEDEFSDTKATVAKADKKAADAVKALADANAKHVDYLTKAEVDGAALKLASELSPAAAKVLLPHVRSRLSLDLTDPNAPRVVVLDGDGKPSDKKMEDLAKEFRDNKDFAGIIVASRSSGGVASRPPGTVGGTAFPANGVHPLTAQPKRASDMTAAELAARIAARNPAQ